MGQLTPPPFRTAPTGPEGAFVLPWILFFNEVYNKIQDLEGLDRTEINAAAVANALVESAKAELLSVVEEPIRLTRRIEELETRLAELEAQQIRIEQNFYDETSSRVENNYYDQTQNTQISTQCDCDFPADYASKSFVTQYLASSQSGVVHITGTETITGDKTFTGALKTQDNKFEIRDDGNLTRIAAFSCGNITAGNTRTFTFIDANLILAGSSSALTATRVPYATTGGILTDSSTLTFTSGTGTLTATNLVSTTATIGTGSNNTTFESTGVITFSGSAQVWNDWIFPFVDRTTGVNRPTYNTFRGNLTAPQFAVNDYMEVSASEFTHDWAEGGTVTVHLHWTSMENVAATRGVKWEVEYTYVLTTGGTAQWVTASTLTVETTVPANTPAYTEFITPMGSINLAGGKIGGQIRMRVRRIAATGTAPATDPFGTQVGIHYQSDTVGSRSIASK